MFLLNNLLSFYFLSTSQLTLPKSALYVNTGNFAFSNIKRAYHSQFGEVNRRQNPRFRRIRKKTLQTSVFLIKMAEREGFEPPVPGKEYN